MKNKSFFPILLLATIFVVSGCNNTQPAPAGPSGEDSSSAEPAKPRPLKRYVTIKLDASLRTNNTGDPYKLSFLYDDEYFLTSAKTYNKDLSMLSYGVSVATSTDRRGATFFTDAKFDDIVIHDYDKTPTKDTMGYFMAHKTIGDYELVTVAFRGFNYGLEWANNFIIGKTGNHEGFNARGEEAYEALQNYIAEYAKDKPLKLWINGYSRAGAVSNVLSSLIMKGDKINVAQDNLFVYTYEAPAALSLENAIAYENVHNIINEADLVASIPPETYGLKRCGVDYPIYDANVTSLMKQFDSSIEFPEFKTITDIADDPMDTDGKVLDFVIKTVFEKEEGSSADVYANTREQYVDNYQAGLSSCIGYIFGLKESTRSEMLNALKNLGFGAISIIGDDTGASLMNFIKPYLDRDNVVYDETQLQADCATFIKGVANLFMQLLLMYLLDDYSPSITRLIDMHYPETTYVLLKNAHSK